MEGNTLDTQTTAQTNESSATKRKTRAKKTATVAASAPVKIVPKEIDPEQYVIVRNGFQGQLIYKSKRTGERFVWDEFGAEQEIQLRELRNAKNSNKSFFINNWFMFDEEWVVDYLGVGRYYKNAVRIEDFDKIFENDPATLESIISEMTDGQKKSLAYRAQVLIGEGKIDSIKAISVLERTLNVDLIEH